MVIVTKLLDSHCCCDGCLTKARYIQIFITIECAVALIFLMVYLGKCVMALIFFILYLDNHVMDLIFFGGVSRQPYSYDFLYNMSKYLL